jgi:hypothetical protein
VLCVGGRACGGCCAVKLTIRDIRAPMTSEFKWLVTTGVVLVALAASLSLGVDPEKLGSVIAEVGFLVALLVWIYKSSNRKGR